SPAKSGTPSAPIVFRAQPGANVFVTSTTSGFKLSSRSWITVDGFIIQGTGDDGIYVSGGSNLTLTNNTISYSGLPQSGEIERGIYLSGVSNSTVTGNATHHNTEAGIYLSSSTNHVLVGGNRSWANARGYVRAAPGIDVRGYDNVVTGNTTFANEDTGLQFYNGAARNTVTNNLTYDNGDHGIDNLGATNQVIVANTVFHNVTAGINREGGSTGGYVVNNISVNNGIDSPRTKSNIRVDATSTSGTSVDWNLTWLNTSAVDYIWGKTSYSSLSAFRSATGMETHGIEANPLFVNSTAGDFSLTLDSPAVDSAFADATSQPSVDLLGKPRVDVPGVIDTGAGSRTYDDRGALELQSTSGGATTTSTTKLRTRRS
ncbi:MAG: right-handed parallel beta-helix repeat-containing protein, partial [Actinomycetota bacterium]